MAPSSDSPSKARRALIGVVLVAVLLAAALSGAWFYLAGRLDDELTRAIEQAAGRGTDITCPDREVFGFPFRIGFRCDSISVVRAGDRPFEARGGAVRTAAQIYRPNHVVAEVDAPLRVATPEMPPLDIRWDLAQASATFWTEGLDRFSLVTEEPRVGIVVPGDGGGDRPVVEAAQSEAHARRRDDDLDIFTLMKGGKLTFAGAPDLPPLEASTDLTIAGAGDWLSGAARGQTGRELFAGRQVSLRSLLLEMDTANAEPQRRLLLRRRGPRLGHVPAGDRRPEQDRRTRDRGRAESEGHRQRHRLGPADGGPTFGWPDCHRTEGEERCPRRRHLPDRQAASAALKLPQAVGEAAEPALQRGRRRRAGMLVRRPIGRQQIFDHRKAGAIAPALLQSSVKERPVMR
ncbi:DUF2125 domain-containing protein [Jiella pelagia]|uniref:DUF2125 domain-containing protein n=1 Tax=Jiella pelagia TaxID=2986949 RepID=A0ABY7BZV2_9HYPH|nr:DUF2125 domain-containing protein [Jiella pelagia]WAP68053.1 DUF2125 domain-containing protein [Jiella pelagia]